MPSSPPEAIVASYIDSGLGAPCSSSWLTPEAHRRYIGPPGRDVDCRDRVPDLSHAEIVSTRRSGTRAEVAVVKPRYDVTLRVVNLPWSESEDFIPTWAISDFRPRG